MPCFKAKWTKCDFGWETVIFAKLLFSVLLQRKLRDAHSPRAYLQGVVPALPSALNATNIRPNADCLTYARHS